MLELQGISLPSAPMPPHESLLPAPPGLTHETVTFDELDGHAVVRVETTFVVRDPDAVVEVLQWIERRRTQEVVGSGLLGPTFPHPEA